MYLAAVSISTQPTHRSGDHLMQLMPERALPEVSDQCPREVATRALSRKSPGMGSRNTWRILRLLIPRMPFHRSTRNATEEATYRYAFCAVLVHPSVV